MPGHMHRRASVAAIVVGIAAAGGAAATVSAVPSSAARKPAASKPQASKPTIQVASVSTGGAQGNGDSWMAAISANGKYVAFSSFARNLVPGTTTGEDVFVRDLTRGLTRLATLDTAGEQSFGARAKTQGLSKDGRYVVFTSDAGTLVPDDTNGDRDVFVRDMRYGITRRASLTMDGSQISRFSVGQGISGDGRYVLFTTFCGCVVPGDTFKDINDVYVRDLKRGTTRRVSVASDGAPANRLSGTAAISADGRYVSFTSLASNLVPGDTNGAIDVFRHDLKTGETIRVSVGPDGMQASGGRTAYASTGDRADVSLSANGRHVAFYSNAQGLVDSPHSGGDVYVRDVKSGTTILASAGLGGVAKDFADSAATAPRISGDGRYVAFTSYATNLVAGDTNAVADGFVRDLKKGTTRRVAITAEGQQANGTNGFDLVLDHDGDTAAFTSVATNLVAGDTNGQLDVFVARLK